MFVFFSFTQESLLLYQMGNLEGCKQLREDVCNQAVKFNSPNYNVIAGKCFVWCLQTGKEVYEGWRSLGDLYRGWQLNTSIAPCNERINILGFWIAFCWFWIPGTAFLSLSVELGFWIPMFSACGIPDSLSCIPDSNTKNSKFHKQNFPGYTGSGFYYMGRLASNMNGYSIEK